MKQPRTIWLLFALSLAVVLAALGWLSWIALGYERAEARTLAQAEFEEDVRLALWRMDALALNWPRHVRLNFRVSAEGEITSPLLPEVALDDKRSKSDAAREAAERMARTRDRFDQLSKLVTREALALRLRDGLAVPGPPLRIAATTPPSFGQDKLLEPGRRSRRGAPQQTQISNAQYAARLQSLQNLSQNSAFPGIQDPTAVGTTNPVWIAGQLLLIHRGDNKDDLQAAWVDWANLRDDLLADVSGQFPRGELRHVTDAAAAHPRRHLAVLPAVFVPGRTPTAAVEAWSPLRTSLAVAWACVLFAAAAVAGLLFGVLRLSERRAAFVSAVTHELRTPLTTFRMYAEMLADGMVPEAKKRQEYLNTMRIESDRLSHLVENVLSYARLERGRPKRQLQTVPVAELIPLVETRLRERTGQAGMELKVEVDQACATLSVRCDPSVVEQILFNLVDNACKYATGGSAQVIHLEAMPEPWIFSRRSGSTADECSQKPRVVKAGLLRIRDHGPGIAAEQGRRLFQPFSKSAHDAAHSAPGVGLGLALSHRLARAMGGNLRFDADYTEGAAFSLTLPRGA